MGIGLQLYDANGDAYFGGSFPLNAHIGLGCSLTVNTKSSVYRQKFVNSAYVDSYHYRVNLLDKSSAFAGQYVSDHPKCFVMPTNGEENSSYTLFAFVNDGSPSANSLKTAIATKTLANLPAMLLVQHDPTYL